MSKAFYKLSTGNFLQNWSDPALFTVDNDWTKVPSIVGYNGAGLATTGKDASTVVADNAPSLTGQVFFNKATTFTSGGVGQFSTPNGGTDAVVGLQGSGSANAPNLVIYLDSTGRQDIRLTLNVRDIDLGDHTNQQVNLQYRVGDTGNWTNIAGGYLADATDDGAATKVTAMDVTLPAAANDQGNLQIRILTVDASGSDEWVGIDDINVSSNPTGGTPPTDTTPPAILSSLPADNASNVAVNANLTITFNEAVQLGTSGDIILTDGASDVRTIAVTDSTQVSLSADGRVLTINPTADLHLSSTYHLTLPQGAVTDIAGNPFAGNASNPVDFATPQPGDNVVFLGLTIGGNDEADGLANELRRAVAEHPCGRGVARTHHAVEILRDDRVVRGLDDGRQVGLLLENLSQLYFAGVPRDVVVVVHVLDPC